ncbi:hypothetical protein L596_026968 [Steinernema carpocapsae]|uniref:E1 domain-containing protein n=1 Tax=Steinernema carpocapsae TaxID=34508 RepID=A0A4U5M331_STECR|nr:hypothetical protein L596_026968 [Steinernema carpocapsae]
MRHLVFSLFAIFLLLPEALAYKNAPFLPMVALKKGYRNQHLTEAGKWIVDQSTHAAYIEDELEILQYCRRMYPDRNISSVVEMAHETELKEWLTYPKSKVLRMTMSVKPWRCVQGKFSSEVVFVPTGCKYYEIKRDDFDGCFVKKEWKLQAEEGCKKRSGVPRLYSLALEEPCGIKHFKGMEYVCCPEDVDLKKKEKNELEDYRRVTQKYFKLFRKILDERNAVYLKYNQMAQKNATHAEKWQKVELEKLDQRHKEVMRNRAKEIAQIGFNIDEQVKLEMEKVVNKDILAAFYRMSHRHECDETITTSIFEALAQKRVDIKSEIAIRATIDHEIARQFAERTALAALNFIDDAAKKVYQKCPELGTHKSEEVWIQLITLGFDFPINWAKYYNPNAIFLHLYGQQLGFYSDRDPLYDAHGLQFTLKPSATQSKLKTTTEVYDYKSSEEEEEEEDEEQTHEKQLKNNNDSIPTFIFISAFCIATPIFVFIGVHLYKHFTRHRNFHKIAGEDILPIMTEDEYNDDSIDDIKEMNVYSNPFDRVQQNSML